MADITKCVNEDCLLKDNCYRFICRADIYQSYDSFEPDEDTGICEYFIDDKNNKRNG